MNPTPIARRPVAERLRRWLIARCAPISIDGQTVESITIDGEDVTEVTMDGDVVFSSGPANAVLRLKADEGSGSTAADSIGSNDGSFNGDPTWVNDTDFVGDYYIDHDNDDLVALDNNTSTIRPGSDWSLGMTITADSGLDGNIAWNWGDGSQHFSLSGINGDLSAIYYDGSSVVDSAAHSQPSTPYTARLYTEWDAGSNSIELSLDTSASSSSPGSGYGSTDQALSVGNNPQQDRGLGAGWDDFIVYDSIGLAQEDYDLQPWT